MPNLDGGHYFLTAIVPINNDGIIRHGGVESSPIHMVRDALETLPTALQSHATEAVGIQSPFARSLRTHFLRLVVLDEPFYNGRDTENSILAAATGAPLLQAQPVDSLACPYLVFVADFDPVDDGRPEPRAYLEELWSLASDALTAVFQYGYGFDAVKDAASFADFIIACQIETTMPFNDYWTVPPPFPSLSTAGLLAPLAIGAIAGLVLWLTEHWSVLIALPVIVILVLIGVAFDYVLIMSRGQRPFPTAPNSTLRHVLKALYLQQAFTRFAIAHQGDDATALRDAFAAFVAEHRPGDLTGPTQPPGVVRSRLPETTHA